MKPVHFRKMSAGTLVIILVLPAFSSSSIVLSQTVFHARPINFGAQAAALGDAYSAQIQDLSSMYWNPASVCFLDRSAPVASAITDARSSVLHHMTATSLWNSKNHSLAGGIVGSYFGREWFRPYFSTLGIDVAYGMKLTPFLSVGTLVNVRYGRTTGSSLWAGSGMVGVLYYPSRGITYGMRLDGIGPGISYTQEGNTQALSYDLLRPRGLTVGSTFRFPTTNGYSIMTFSFDSRLSFGSRDLTNGLGMEVSPWQFLTLRLGFARENSITMCRYGAGIRTGDLQVGYAFVPLSDGNQLHQLSLSAAFVNW